MFQINHKGYNNVEVVEFYKHVKFKVLTQNRLGGINLHTYEMNMIWNLKFCVFLEHH